MPHRKCRGIWKLAIRSFKDENAKKQPALFPEELCGWYTESIPLPYGPYLFAGLPGLIMEIYDTGRNWIFTNNGFGTMPNHASMYIYKKEYIQDLIVTSREKALTGYRNDIEDFDNLSIELFKVKVERNGKMVPPEANNPKRPSICSNSFGK